MRCLADAFAPLLAGHDLDRLESDPSVIYGLCSELRLRYVNPAWFEFARANGGLRLECSEVLGTSLSASISGVLRDFYQRHLESALVTLRPWHHAYECPSPALSRRIDMHVYPLRGGAGLLVVNTLVAEAPHDPALRPERPWVLERYLARDGLVRQCSHCRRVQRADAPQLWEWVPTLLEQPHPETSHTLCGVCLDHYYPRRSPAPPGPGPGPVPSSPPD